MSANNRRESQHAPAFKSRNPEVSGQNPAEVD